MEGTNRPAAEPARGAAGFTLIEVLITVVILAVGIVSVLRAFEVSLAALGEARDSLRTDRVISSRIAAIEVAALREDRSTLSGGARRFSEDGVSGVARVRQIDAGPAGPKGERRTLYEVTVTVLQSGGRGERSVTAYVAMVRRE